MSAAATVIAALPAGLLAELAAILGERVSTKDSVLEQHGHDESYHAPSPPQAVVFPLTTEDVSRVAAACHRHRVAMIPFGAGTSLEGGVAALRGGVCIDLSRMNGVVEINAEDMDCRVQAGLTRKELNTYLRYTGLFFPVDPGANATLGGMASTRASGTNAVRYGTMKDVVLGLTVVLADGTVLKTGGRARKSSAGYDLTRLFVGAEGTLGIVTEVAVRLFPVPDAISAAVCAFADLRAAVETVIAVIQLGIPVARVELMDELGIESINRYSKLDYSVAPTLFFEFQGSESAVREQAERVQEIASERGARDFVWTSDDKQREGLWAARHSAYYAALAMRPGCKGWPTDVCVPISRLADCILETKADLATTKIISPIIGHVGDGNFHLVYLLDPEDAGEVAEAEAFNDRLIRRALSMGGTCTGEHGIGYGKKAHLIEEHGEAAVEVMRSIKRALDPLGLMNPGKVAS